MDRKELVRILSTDLSEGFDTLCPALTIKKLEAYGFGNRSLDLMRSFFDRRFNRVPQGYCIWTASVEYVSK